MVIPIFTFHVNHLDPLCACHDCLYGLCNAFLSDVSQGGKHRHLAELELSSLWLLIVTWTFRSPRKWAPDVSKWESVWTWAAPVERKERLMSFFFFFKGWPWKEVGLGGLFRGRWGWGGLFRGRLDGHIGEGFAFLSSFSTLPPPFPLTVWLRVLCWYLVVTDSDVVHILLCFCLGKPEFWLLNWYSCCNWIVVLRQVDGFLGGKKTLGKKSLDLFRFLCVTSQVLLAVVKQAITSCNSTWGGTVLPKGPMALSRILVLGSLSASQD